MDGRRHQVTSADGTTIGLLTAGDGPPLLLVHGGPGQIERWRSLWDTLAARWRVTAMDRRGRGTSGDTSPYELSREFEDVTAVAASLAGGDPVDVFGHSYGATCALGAAASGAPVRRLALYEPPGPQAAPPEWRDRIVAMFAEGRPGPAMVSFLREVIGLSESRIGELRARPADYDVLAVASATIPRESAALATVDLRALAVRVQVPVLLVLGSASPAWAHDISTELAAALPRSTLAVLDGQGHEAIDDAPGLLAGRLAGFFS